MLYKKEEGYPPLPLSPGKEYECDDLKSAIRLIVRDIVEWTRAVEAAKIEKKGSDKVVQKDLADMHHAILILMVILIRLQDRSEPRREVFFKSDYEKFYYNDAITFLRAILRRQHMLGARLFRELHAFSDKPDEIELRVISAPSETAPPPVLKDILTFRPQLDIFVRFLVPSHLIFDNYERRSFDECEAIDDFIEIVDLQRYAAAAPDSEISRYIDACVAPFEQDFERSNLLPNMYHLDSFLRHKHADLVKAHPLKSLNPANTFSYDILAIMLKLIYDAHERNLSMHGREPQPSRRFFGKY